MKTTNCSLLLAAKSGWARPKFFSGTAVPPHFRAGPVPFPQFQIRSSATGVTSRVPIMTLDKSEVSVNVCFTFCSVVQILDILVSTVNHIGQTDEDRLTNGARETKSSHSECS